MSLTELCPASINSLLTLSCPKCGSLFYSEEYVWTGKGHWVRQVVCLVLIFQWRKKVRQKTSPLNSDFKGPRPFTPLRFITPVIFIIRRV